MTRPWLSALLAIAVTGCGSGAVAPKTDDPSPPVTAQLSTKPTPPLPPATVYPARELAKIFDAAALPTIEGTTFNERSAACLRGSAPGTVADVAAFYLKEVSDLGWKKQDSLDSRPIADHFGAAFFKDGHQLNLMLSKEPSKDGAAKTRINLHFHGNLDTRALPKPKNAPHAIATQPMSSYFSERQPSDEAAWISKALIDAGWQEFALFNSARLATNLSLSFRKRGYVLDVFITAVPHRENFANVTYSVRTLAHELPAPPHASNIEFDDRTWKLRCDVADSLPAVAEFYKSAFPETGFAEVTARTEPSTLVFANRADDVVVVELRKKDERTTQVNIAGVAEPPPPPKKPPEAIAVAPKKPVEPIVPPKTAVAKTPVVEKLPVVDPPPLVRPPVQPPTTKPSVPGKELFAAQVPLPKDAKTVDRDAAREEITFRMTGKIPGVAATLREQLTAAGWQEQKSVSVVDSSAGYLDFRQADASLRIILVNTGLGGGTQISISTKGLTWPKAGT